LKVKKFTEKKGVDIILDPILGTAFNYNMKSLGYEGKVVLYGSLGGFIVEDADFRKLFAVRGQILTSTIRMRSDEYKAKLVKEFQSQCLNDFESGKLKPIIDRSFKLSEIKQAHDYMESNASIGKIVLLNDL